jgi:beta-glucanase (GH16 family)
MVSGTMKKLNIYFLFLCLFPLCCLAQRPAQGPMTSSVFKPLELGYRLVWEDEFLGIQLDTTKWKPRGLGKRALGYVSKEAIRVENGLLKLQALKRNDSILISAVGTQDLFMPRYGYFECRAQLQKSPGVWGAFWLQSPRLSEGSDPQVYGAEVDIMEFFKKLGKDIVSHNVHWGPYGAGQQSTRGMQSYLQGVSEGFHTFGLEWTEDKYAFFVDGLKFYEVQAGVSRIPEYLILSMEIPNALADLSKTVYPDEFLVDYVKVYQKP